MLADVIGQPHQRRLPEFGLLSFGDVEAEAGEAQRFAVRGQDAAALGYDPPFFPVRLRQTVLRNERIGRFHSFGNLGLESANVVRMDATEELRDRGTNLGPCWIDPIDRCKACVSEGAI